MGYYNDGRGNSFFPAVYVKEDDDVLERQLKLLRKQGENY